MFTSRKRRKERRFISDGPRYKLPQRSREQESRKWSLSRKIRFFLTLLLGAVLLSLLELRWKSGDLSKSIRVEESSEIIDDKGYYHGEEVVYNGEVKLKNLQAVPARLAKLSGLGNGSREAQKRQLEEAKRLNLPLEVVNSIGMSFRLIPPGLFTMGSEKEQKGRKEYENKGIDIESQHNIEIENGFYVGKYEVTRGQWNMVMKNWEHSKKSFKGENLPMEEITWYDVVNFCKKLCELEGVPEGRYRPLLEREWEYVCRAGTDTPFYFAKLSEADKYMNYGSNSRGRPSVVGRKSPNAWGIFDMHGNVMEWCVDHYIDYFTGKQRDGDRRNIRGGSWYHKWEECRSANRARLTATSYGNMLGFRIMRPLVVELEELEKENQD
ncbi:MAG: formylglycine-generating enzyme family protein [Lentisphaeria bacterium]